MALSDKIKRAAEKIAGDRPGAKDVKALLRERTPNTFVFVDDGLTPNNRLPLVHYKSPVSLGDWPPAAMFEVLFEANGWKPEWRDGIFDFNHFHTRTHEVIGIARGRAKVRYGGAKGRTIELKAGDVVIHPAGVGHERLTMSRDLLVVGAYPTNGGKYDQPRSQDVSHAKALQHIQTVPLPPADPVYGKKGALLKIWRAAH